MGDGLARVLAKNGFDPDSFVTKIALGGEEDLQNTHTKVLKLAEDTSVALKKNVYKNYSQFIETAKEISILEGEMYQLSHLLTDQKSVMTSLMELSLTGSNVHTPSAAAEAEVSTPEQDTSKNLAFLLEKVEGCAQVTEVAGRQLIHSGDLLEVDCQDFAPLNKVHIFLLNDSLLIATWLPPHRRGPVKYRFEALYELDSLAVVNARDVSNCKNAFKVLMFPDTRMYQADSPKEKRQWLDILDETKRAKSAADSQRKEAASLANTPCLDPDNPFSEAAAETPSGGGDRASLADAADALLLGADWLAELPEDLDVAIAQRDFEGAVDLVEKVTEHLEGCPKVAAVREYRARIDHRVKQLTQVLMQELQVSPERSIRGGPRSARRAVTQLIRLGKSAQACELFLANRGAIIRHNLRQLKIEGATALYVRRLCQVFFSNLTDTAAEFVRAFPQHYGCFSAFVLWSRKELGSFVKMFTSQVFAGKTNFSTIAECVHEARSRCIQLEDLGLSLAFVLDSLLAADITKVVQSAGDHQMEAIRHRATDDGWAPCEFADSAALDKFEEEMIALGLVDIQKFTDSSSLRSSLTENTAHFARSYSRFCADLLRLYAPAHHPMLASAFVDILTCQLQHAKTTLQAGKAQKAQVAENARFLHGSVLPLVGERFLAHTHQPLPGLDALVALHRGIQREAKS